MLYKTILELKDNLSKDEKIDDICNNIYAALEEIQNYQIAYIQNVPSLSLNDKEKEFEEIISSLNEIINFIEKSLK